MKNAMLSSFLQCCSHVHITCLVLLKLLCITIKHSSIDIWDLLAQLRLGLRTIITKKTHQKKPNQKKVIPLKLTKIN